MLTIDEALAAVRQHVSVLPSIDLPTVQSVGLALASPVVSDIDSPPYDKAMMDGFAVRSDDLAGGSAELIVLEEIVAGTTPSQQVESGTATKIMTGAPIPSGADAVVMIEQCETIADGSKVRINAQPKPGSNILKQATSLAKGAEIFPSGVTVRPIEVGILSEIGYATVSVIRRPRVAVLSTGDELVGANEMPGPGQIRNSNGPMLEAMIRQAGAEAIPLGVAHDNREDLREKISRGLAADILILSGGVSAGVMDLVPSVLNELSVDQVFHKVQMKPGKPLWFGQLKKEGEPTFVFGLPGNPVSSLVCFHLFVRQALRRMLGDKPIQLGQQRAVLTSPFANRGDRPVFFPAATKVGTEGSVQISPLPWKGSADLATLSRANAFAFFPAYSDHETGQLVDFIWV